MRRSESWSLRYRLALGLGLAMLFAATARAEDKPTCTAAIFGAGQVQAVLDGRPLRFSDRRTVRLAGIESIREPDEADSRANNAKRALEYLVFNRPITLMRLGPGNRPARQACRFGGPAIRFIRPRRPARDAGAGARPGGGQHRGFRLCRYLAAEKTARAGGLGLWANPDYVMSKAEDPAEVLAAGPVCGG